MPATTKHCTRCGHTRPTAEEYNAAGRNRDREFQRKYGITLAEREALAQAQDHRCLACQKPEAECRNGRLYVDHCHTTGAVRALLCSVCNLALGMLNDDPEALRRLAHMVEEARAV